LVAAVVGSVSLAACGAVAGGAPGGARTQAVAASCAALTPAQQFKAAHVVFDGTMLSGPTALVGGQRALSSPARVRVIGYLKGHGPAVVRVDTGSAAGGGGIVVREDGIEPVAGQSWRIYSDASRQPFTTSICAGSRLLRPSDKRPFTGEGVSFAYPSAWQARRYEVTSSFSSVIVYLSPQAMHPPCVTHHGTANTTITCMQPVSRLDRDSILARWSTNGWPGWSFKRAPGTPLRVGGRRAKVQITRGSYGIGAEEMMSVVVEKPGIPDNWYELDAYISGPDTSRHEQQVRQLVRTVHLAR
jgi:hypothetical protein